MSKTKETKIVESQLSYISKIFTEVVKIIPNFDITNPDILPYGLKPHTRSVSWIVEQVIVQQTKVNASYLNLRNVNFNLPDTCLHDCIITSNAGDDFFVNIKVTSSNKKTKNDISAVEKLYMQYTANPSYNLIFAVFKFSFQNIKILLANNRPIHTFSPQFLPIYVNPRNDKIQADYYANPIIRSRNNFLENLKKSSTSIIL